MPYLYRLPLYTICVKTVLIDANSFSRLLNSIPSKYWGENVQCVKKNWVMICEAMKKGKLEYKFKNERQAYLSFFLGKKGTF